MTSLLEMQIASSDLSNAQLKQDLVRNYTADLVKIEGNLFTFEDVWDGSDKENLGRLGSSLLHELERTGFILADHSEEDLLHFTDPVLYMSVLSKPSLASEDKPTEINSFVVSMTLGALNHSVSFSPKGGQVLLRLQHAVRESGPYFRKLYRWRRDGEAPSMIPRSAVCVYWNTTSSTWVPDGCQLITTNHDVTYCSCSHLSMISIITDVHSYVGRDATLDVLGTLLSSLSCVALVLAFLILQFCKGVQASPRIAITKQLCISLFLSHFFLILFLDRDFLKLSAEACKVVAGLLHYLLTASIGWMLAEGLQLFHTVHFTLDPTNFIVTYWLVGYGLPVVVVLVTALVAFGSDQWKTQEAYAPPGSELCIKGSFSLNCILGVTWVFGLLYINTEHVFAYLFTIFNASQGVMIFVFNCMLNENVRTALVTSLPRAIKQRLMSKASQNGLSSGRGSSGACTTYNRPVNHHHHHSHHHHHHHRQPAPVSPADQETTLHNDSRPTALEYPATPPAVPGLDMTKARRRRRSGGVPPCLATGSTRRSTYPMPPYPMAHPLSTLLACPMKLPGEGDKFSGSQQGVAARPEELAQEGKPVVSRHSDLLHISPPPVSPPNPPGGDPEDQPRPQEE
ncbi:Adhesion G protein-coupled receptor L3 [Chionoecetes opilio]|uniref:Adhesion G protein-coupled receptor L3 n=1 Tax=Chionoecetes opilio TaxID=41210 RepID=A0A8J5CQ42_CHIOP|nr:Adhesion G protein-coupled receptor L3 [Chionoecetes opilio]